MLSLKLFPQLDLRRLSTVENVPSNPASSPVAALDGCLAVAAAQTPSWWLWGCAACLERMERYVKFNVDGQQMVGTDGDKQPIPHRPLHHFKKTGDESRAIAEPFGQHR